MTNMDKECTYVCTLSHSAQRMAFEELRESTLMRSLSLKRMRDWILTNPRIRNSRTDPSFLLRFLRANKFDLNAACEALERYISLRQTVDGFKMVDFDSHNVNQLISSGFLFALPRRDSLGRRIVMARIGVFDPQRHTKEDVLWAHGLMFETLLEDEENQVRGLVYVGDAGGVSLSHVTLFSPAFLYRIIKNGENTIPIRHKIVHTFNVHPALKFFIEFGLSLFSEKMKKRAKFYKCLEELIPNFDMSLLPAEYGGTTPLNDMVASWRAEILAARHMLSANDAMVASPEELVHRDKRLSLSSNVPAMNDWTSYLEGTSSGLVGSFRKLSTD